MNRLTTIAGIPSEATSAIVYITNAHQNAEASLHEVHNGTLNVDMPADSFVSIIAQ